MSRLTRDGTAEPVSRDQIFRHARGQGNIIFPVQLTTSRIGNLTRLIHTLLHVMTIHTYIKLIPPREDQCEWHRMTRMTGPDCVVMCNLINTYIRTYIHTIIIIVLDRVSPEFIGSRSSVPTKAFARGESTWTGQGDS